MSENGESSSRDSLIESKQPAKASISQLYQFASKTDILVFIFALFIACILSCLPIVMIILLGELMKSIQDNRSDLDKFYEVEKRISIIMICLGVLSALLGWISAVCFVQLGNKLSMAYRDRYFSIVINKPVKWYDKNNPAELGSVINKDCKLIEQALGEKFLIGFTSLMLFFGSWIAAFIINFELSLIAIFIMPFQILAGLMVQKTNQKESQIYQEKYASSSGIAEENVEGVKTIAACNAQQSKAKSFQKEFEDLKSSRIYLSIIFGFGAGLMYCIVFSFTGVLNYFGAYIIAKDPEVFGYSTSASAVDSIIIFFLTALNTINLGASLPCIVAFEQGRQAAGRVNNLILKNKKYDGNLKIDSMRGSIEFKKVCFNYPSSPNLNVLQGVSFVLEPGMSLALVGETGCGKSTIIQLISGFYYADSGTVKIDDVDIKKYDLKSLRRFVSLVSQEPMVFNCSIRENIRMGNPEATDTEVEQAASEAEAKSFILKLPNKFDTLVGVKGCQISGGQKQRIAIARAILKMPKILLLDEATSALDMKTEKKIQNRLKEIIKGKTTIIAAQRLSTIKAADKIAVISEGKIIESGTFNDLELANGAFFKLLGGECLSSKNRDDFESINKSDSSSSISPDNDFHSLETHEISKGQVLVKLLFIIKRFWIWITIAFICAVFAGAAFPVFGYFFAENAFYLLNRSESSAEQECKKNMGYLFIVGAVILFSITLAYFSISQISFSYSHMLRYQVMSSLLYFDQEFFDTPGNTPASLTCRLTSNCDNVSKIGGLVLVLQIVSIASIVVGVTISMMYNVIMSLVAILFIPVMVYTFAKHQNMEKNGLAPKNVVLTAEIVSDSLTNIRTVQSLNQQESFTLKYLDANQTENESSKINLVINGLMFGFRLSFMYTLRACLAWLGAYLAKKHEISMENFLIVFYNLSFATWCFNLVGFFASDIQSGFESAGAVFEIIDNVPIINAKSEYGSISNISGKIEFKNVSFSYKSRDVQVLNQVSFKLEAGQRLGITGTTGSGKSTIAQLLLRFYNPISGEILIDDVNIEEYNINYLRKCVAWVGQEPILFKGSILDNIKLGNQNITSDRAIEAAQEAQASDIIEKYGLDSDVGLRGNRLSGGQKQRIAIARALVRSPKILILDESTSALDSITENLLEKKLMEKHLTIIAISHRLHTIQEFDSIIVIEKGFVVESGTHDKLLQLENGFYRDLFNSK